jgi:hypothetical protein
VRKISLKTLISLPNKGSYDRPVGQPLGSSKIFRAMVLECLEAELLGDHDGDHVPGTNKLPPSVCLYLHSIQRYVGVTAAGCVPRTLPPTPAPLLHRSQVKNLEISLGKRKA